MREGKFITLEGSEGTGKSTQAKRIAEKLKAHGIAVVLTREPGGTAGAEAIRTLLMTGDEARWNAETEALLFAAARADHVAKLIRPALARGDWVICDRFVDSTRAYQGGAGGLSDDAIMALHAIGSGGLLPVKTLLLDMDLAVAEARASMRDGNAKDRMGSKSTAYYERVTAAFRALAKHEPERFAVIDAGGNEDAVTAASMYALQALL
jgi:dTMP kinase